MKNPDTKVALVLGVIAFAVVLGVGFHKRAAVREETTKQARIEDRIQQKARELQSSEASSSETYIDHNGLPAGLVPTVLADYEWDGTKKSGLEFLRSIQTKRISGETTTAMLQVSVDDLDGDGGRSSGLAMYFAGSAEEGGHIDPSTEWRRTRYVVATWAPGCKRQLSPKSTLLAFKGSKQSFVMDIHPMPLTALDPCSTKEEWFDLLDAINAPGDVFLGFHPSAPGYRVKVTLWHDGGLTVSDF